MVGEEKIEYYRGFGLVLSSGSKAKVAYKDAVIDDPKQRRPDITLAKSWLNWQPKVNRSFRFRQLLLRFRYQIFQISLSDGLNRTIAYFRNELLVKHHSERNVFFPHEWLHASNGSSREKTDL